MKMIAEQLVVSESTVSLALSGRTCVAPETRSRGQRATEEMGFEPHIQLPESRRSAFDYMHLALAKIQERGYRRIFCLLNVSESGLDNTARLGALLAVQRQSRDPRVEIDFIYHSPEAGEDLPKAVVEAIAVFSPEVILVDVWIIYYPLERAGFKIPEKIAVAAVITNADPVVNTPRISGCDRSLGHLYRIVCNEIRAGILLRNLGVFHSRMEHVVEPVWFEGETLPPVLEPSVTLAEELYEA